MLPSAVDIAMDRGKPLMESHGCLLTTTPCGEDYMYHPHCDCPKCALHIECDKMMSDWTLSVALAYEASILNQPHDGESVMAVEP